MLPVHFRFRLGLGAKHDPSAHKSSMTEDERRIAGSMRAAAARERARVEDEGRDSDDHSGDNEDSRASNLKRNTKCVYIALLLFRCAELLDGRTARNAWQLTKLSGLY